MADNFTLKNDDSTTVGTLAADEVTYSGDSSIVPLSRLVHVSGSEGSKTTSEVFAAAGSASANVLSVQGVASMTALTVDGSGVTQPVSGTVTANLSATDNAVLDAIAASLAGTLTVGSHAVTNAGTFAVQAAITGDLPDTTAGDLAAINAALSGTLTVGSHAVTNAGTFAVQAAQSGTWNIADITGTVSLPTGAATAAKQPALGTAGTASSDVITVQGIASMTALVVDGSGVTQPVSGTITANLSATDNAVLDAIAASVAGTLTVGSHDVTNAGTFAVQAAQSGTWNVTNITGTVSLPTGAATAAKQPALGTAGTASSDVITVQGIASMTAIVVDGSGVTQPVSGTITANLSATDNAVLDAIAASVAGTLTVGTHAVTNAGTFAVQLDGDALTALQLIDDAIYADDAVFTLTSSKVMMSGAIRDDSLSTLSAVEGDAVPLRVNSTGALHVTGGGGGTEYTEDVATPNPIVGSAVMMERDDALSAVTPVEGDWISFRGTAEGALWTQDFNSDALLASILNIETDIGDIAAGSETLTVANAGTFAVQSTLQTGSATIGAVNIAAAQTLANVTTVTTLTGGGVAHDSADSGNPHKIGAKAESSTAGATLVADGDRTDVYADLDGALLVRNGRPLGDLLHNRVSNTNGTSTAFTGDFAAAGASTKNYVTGYSIANTSSSDVYVDFRDGTSGTVLWTVPLPANGGANVATDEPLFGTSANTALAYDVSAATTTVYISVTGFKSKV